MKSILFVLLSVTLAAQTPTITSSKTKKQAGPRALAVVRWQADEKGNGHPVLLPVAVLDEGKLFDASIYRTSPQPMALEPGTVYEARHHGLPVGLFTVSTATRSNSQEKPWIALGKWKLELFAPEDNKDAQQANVIIGTPKATNDLPPLSNEDTRERRATQVYDEAGRPIDDPKNDEPPTLDKKKRPDPIERRPQISPPAPPPQKPAEPNTSEDPDRPRLHKGAPTTNPSPAPEQPMGAVATTQTEDPNRPVLKRGRPGEREQVAEKGDTPIEKEVIANAAAPRPRTYEMAAISDADTSKIVQNYSFRASFAERQDYFKKVQQLVETELAQKGSPAGTAKARRGKPADPSRFADVRFEIFDLDTNNSPEMVFTGSYVISATQRIPFMLVARGDYESNPRKLKFEKGERFEFIDAVDLDGDGPGELLFRNVTSSGSTFVLYRASPDGLTEIFRGGSAD
jgi:hypothetical protein